MLRPGNSGMINWEILNFDSNFVYIKFKTIECDECNNFEPVKY